MPNNFVEMDDLSLSSVMRELNKNLDKNDIRSFLSIYKNIFDKEVLNNSDDLENISLISALSIFDDENKDLDIAKIVKKASNENAITVGRYLANIIKFIINRIPYDKRVGAIPKLREKILNFDAKELAETDLPEYAAVGQAITFLKHTLFKQDPIYIKSIINVILANI